MADEDVKKRDEDEDDDEEEEEDDEDEGDEEEDEEEEAPAKPAPKPAAKSDVKSDVKPAAKADLKPAAKVDAKPASKPGAAPAKPGARPAAKGQPLKPVAKKPPQKGGAMGKSLLLFVFVVGGLAMLFLVFGKDDAGPKTPTWNAGQDVDVEITLVKSDGTDLACGSPEVVGGKHCAFEGENKAWSKDNTTDDKVIFRPYTTTDRVQFVAAGLWSQPEMAMDKLPGVRFNVKCKYKVEGKIPKLSVRWSQSENKWYPSDNWYAGAVHDCKVIP